jgi:hypothetical protein
MPLEATATCSPCAPLDHIARQQAIAIAGNGNLRRRGDFGRKRQIGVRPHACPRPLLQCGSCGRGQVGSGKPVRSGMGLRMQIARV